MAKRAVRKAEAAEEDAPDLKALLEDLVVRYKAAIDATVADPTQIVKFTPLTMELEELVQTL